jgi:glycosyltransferase 2 family protein
MVYEWLSKKWVKYFIAFAILAFMLLNIRNSCSNLEDFNINIDFYSLLKSCLLCVFFYVNQLMIWYLITKSNKCEITFWETIETKCYTNFGKYVPGKILPYVLLIKKYKDHNKSSKLISYCLALEVVLASLSSIVIFLTSITTSFFNYGYLVAVICFSLLCFSFFIHPFVLNKVIAFVFRLLKKDAFLIKNKYVDLLKIFFSYTINWIIFGFAFTYFINAFFFIESTSFLYLSGAVSISSIIGFFAFFVPAGAGVREGALSYFLGFVLTSPYNSIIAVTSRIWLIISEVIVLLIVSFVSLLGEKTSKRLPFGFIITIFVDLFFTVNFICL